MRSRSRKAFTLVEIMIAAVLASLITLSAVAAVRIVTRGREKVEKYSEVNSEMRYIAESMRRDLRNIYRSASGRKFVGETLSTEAGRVPSLTFYTTRPSNVRRGQPEGDICEVQYTVGVRDGANVMLRRLWPNPSEDIEPSGVVSVLSDNITGFDIKYLDDKEWRSDWPADMGKDCEIMLVSIVAQVPGESQRVARSFMVSFPRRMAMTATPTTTEVATAGQTGAAATTGGASTAVSTGAGGVSNAVPGGRRSGTGEGSGRGGGRRGGQGQGGTPPDGQGGRPPGPPPDGQGGTPPGPPPDGQGGPPSGGQDGSSGGGRRNRTPGGNTGGGAQQ